MERFLFSIQYRLLIALVDLATNVAHRCIIQAERLCGGDDSGVPPPSSRFAELDAEYRRLLAEVLTER